MTVDGGCAQDCIVGMPSMMISETGRGHLLPAFPFYHHLPTR